MDSEIKITNQSSAAFRSQDLTESLTSREFLEDFAGGTMDLAIEVNNKLDPFVPLIARGAGKSVPDWFETTAATFRDLKQLRGVSKWGGSILSAIDGITQVKKVLEVYREESQQPNPTYKKTVSTAMGASLGTMAAGGSVYMAAGLLAGGATILTGGAALALVGGGIGAAHLINKYSPVVLDKIEGVAIDLASRVRDHFRK